MECSLYKSHLTISNQCETILRQIAGNEISRFRTTRGCSSEGPSSAKQISVESELKSSKVLLERLSQVIFD